MKNPFLGNTKNLYIYFLVWAVIATVHTIIINYYYEIQLIPAIADALIFNLIFSGLGLSFWYSVRFLKPENDKFGSLLTNHFILLLVYISVWLILGYFILKILTEGDTTYNYFLYHSLPLRIVSGVFYYAALVMIYYLYIYYISFRENITREASLRTLVKETELSMLKSQLNPHFIFNSLNSINSLTITNPPLAREMIVKLSSFLRYALEQNSKHLITLREEVENCILYLDIEKTRFGEKLNFEKDIHPDVEGIKIPNLILQPLIENAIIHGVYEATDKVTIHLSANIDKEFLTIRVKNNFDPEAVPKKGKGIGIKNVKERLFLIYEQRELLNIKKGEDAFEATIYIPQKQQ